MMSFWVWAKYLVWVLATILLHAHHLECCVEEERLALLELESYMKSYADPKYDDSFHWSDNNAERYNCCAWEMVRCNPSTGRVTELHLNDTVWYSNRPWLFNVTIFQSFGELIHLDLSDNNINGLVESDGSTKISTLKNLRFLSLMDNEFTIGYFSIGDLTSLEKLNLRDCSLNKSSFSLQDVCGMKKLTELNLRDNFFNGGLPSCFQNLSSLKVLDLSYNNFNGKIPKALSSLRSLEHLDLFNNYFEGKFSLTSLSNLSKLHFLLLSKNKLEVVLEDSSWRPTFQLQRLGLGGCNLNKTFETFVTFLSHQTNLSYLDLSHNSLYEALPTWLLGNNYLTGSLRLPHSVNLSLLQELDISNNNFHEKLPENIGFVFPQLQCLNLSGNHFEGPIPTSVGHLRDIQWLDLSHNNFSGELPRRLLSDCKSLKFLVLSDNNIEGDIIPNDMNLPQLEWFALSNNRFGGTIKDSLQKSSFLWYLDISNNNITGQLPWWIGNFSQLYSLSVSQNNLEGKIPKGICTWGSRIDLSWNNFSGPIPSCSNYGPLLYLNLHGNNLSGELPYALTSCSDLQALVLSDNQLSGGIPLWFDQLSSLRVLLLAGNNLYGPIPRQMCQLGNINILDLSRNKLHGEIPKCFWNMSFGMNTTISSLTYDFGTVDGRPIAVQLLDKNQRLPYNGRSLDLMSLLDLSCNKFTGLIPPQLGELNKIQSLNLSHNFLTGSIPTQFSNLKHVESMDLSYNNLSGIIPSQLIELNFLAIFNVSYNNLSGRVPETEQFASFDESNYLGNPGLYGYHVNKPINALPLATSTTTEEDEGDDQDHGGIDMVDFLWSFCMSFATMFLTTLVILYINPQWLVAFFDFVGWHVF